HGPGLSLFLSLTLFLSLSFSLSLSLSVSLSLSLSLLLLSPHVSPHCLSGAQTLQVWSCLTEALAGCSPPCTDYANPTEKPFISHTLKRRLCLRLRSYQAVRYQLIWPDRAGRKG